MSDELLKEVRGKLAAIIIGLPETYEHLSPLLEKIDKYLSPTIEEHLEGLDES